ncbi:phosphopantetheine-binding protein [Crossiella sp. CA198]|uniref:phosphopantetheine-binding protein n=1 Tax=Crossiella sp. CA198 TaxID=3455607 RepID=UPI003F8D5CD0
MPTLTTVDELCALIQDCVAWTEDDVPVAVTPDTELLALGLLDSLTIRRIVAELAAAGVAVPDTRVVAATFRSPAALWQVVTELRDAA